MSMKGCEYEMTEFKTANYINLVRFLGDLLGDEFEIIFHVIKDDEVYIAEIVNGQISGRTVDSPITQFALDLIKDERHKEVPYISGYRTKTIDNKTLWGSTFFIKDDNNHLLGMICINRDTSQSVAMLDELMKHLNIPNDLWHPDQAAIDKDAADDPIEVLSQSVDDIIAQVIDTKKIDDNVQLTKQYKVEIIDRLDDKGVFQIKGAVTKVAEALNISEPSVYRYRKMINHG